MALQRRSKIILAALGLGVLGATLLFVPKVIFKPLAEQFLHLHGFPDARISSLSVVPSGIIIDHISLDGDDFSTVDGISIEGDWLAMMNGRIESLTIKDITLAAEIDEDGHYSISGWNAELPSGDNNAGLLPIKNILLQGITIDAETPQGNIRAEGKFSLSTPSGTQQVFQYTSWGRQKQLSYELSGKGELSSAGTWSTSTTIEDGRVSIADVDISRTSGYIDIAKPKVDASITAKGHVVAGRVNYDKILLQNIDTQFDSTKPEALTFSASPSGHGDVKFAATWQTTPQSMLSLSLSGKKISEMVELLSDDKKEAISPLSEKWLSDIPSFTVVASAPLSNWMADDKKINLEVTLGSGSKSLSLAPIITYSKGKGLTACTIPDTSLDAATLNSLLPIAENMGIKLSSGVIQVKGDVPFHQGDPSSTSALTIHLDKVSAEIAGMMVDDINGTSIFKGLAPISFSSPSNITYSLSNNLGKGIVTVSGQQGGGIKITKFEMDVAGGSITADPFTLPSDDIKPVTTILHFKRIDISKLTAIADVDGLTGQGSISGQIPLTIKGGSVTLGAALLENDSDGAFKFAPSTYPPSLQGDDERMETVRQSLKDFRFTKLSLSMSGPLSGKMVTALKAEGNSPAFGTRPIHLNLNLEGDLASLIKNIMGGLTLPEGGIRDKLRSSKGTAGNKP